MKQTITEKAAAAVNQLNKSALVLARQMKSGELDTKIAESFIGAANQKVRLWRNSYFSRTANSEIVSELNEFEHSELQAELETANNRFGKLLTHYENAVGAKEKQI